MKSVTLWQENRYRIEQALVQPKHCIYFCNSAELWGCTKKIMNSGTPTGRHLRGNFTRHGHQLLLRQQQPSNRSNFIFKSSLNCCYAKKGIVYCIRFDSEDTTVLPFATQCLHLPPPSCHPQRILRVRP